MRVSKYNSQESNMASVGAFGFSYYDSGKTVETEGERYVAAINAYEDAVISEIASDSVDIPEKGFTVPAGFTLLLHSSKVVISSGEGVVYYGGA